MLKYTIPILLLAASGLQGQPLPEDYCSKPKPLYEKQVTIQLVKDSKAVPQRACVARTGTVQWCSVVGDWAVAFAKDKSPFPEKINILHVGKRYSCTSPIQVKHCPASEPFCRFKYTSQVNPYPPFDPDIEIEPGP